MNTEELRKAIPEKFNLSFKDVIYRKSSNCILAFVIALDKGEYEKYYWGVVRQEGNKEDIQHIMSYGSKWDGVDDNGNILL